MLTLQQLMRLCDTVDRARQLIHDSQLQPPVNTTKIELELLAAYNLLNAAASAHILARKKTIDRNAKKKTGQKPTLPVTKEMPKAG